MFELLSDLFKVTSIMNNHVGLVTLGGLFVTFGILFIAHIAESKQG